MTSMAVDRKAATWGLVGVALVLAVTFLGSGQLVWFDAALIGYLFGVVFLVFGVIYRYSRVVAAAVRRRC